VSGERTVLPGERRVEAARRRHGSPVRPGPVAVGAIVGGAAGAWAADVHGRLLALVSSALAGGAATASVDGAAEVRSILWNVAAAAWVPMCAAALGAVAGTLLQTGGRVRRLGAGGSGLRLPQARAALATPLRAVASMAVLAAGGAALWGDRGTVSAIAAMAPGPALSAAISVAVDAMLAAFAALAAVAAADVAVARWAWRRSLRMSPEQAREERRSSEGDPSLRARGRAAVRGAVARTVTAPGRRMHGQAA
jgi:flagellar biosynthetic protein FlhB